MKARFLRSASSLGRFAVPALLGGLAVGVATQTHPGEARASAPVVAAPGPVLDTAALVAKVKASVVNITVESSAKNQDSDMSPFEFFRRNGPAGRTPEVQKRRALGSGFLIDDKGRVLTNAHVVEGADKVRVKLADEREYEARVKGKDERLDIAVLEIIGAKDLPYATLGSSNATQVGEPVVAIGNPFGLGSTVTSGIVSAKGRAIGAGPYDDFLQTDASINPGNSGGPLFDQRGQVVGMNTAIAPNGQGIGFAIPSDEIREVLPQLIASGHVSRGRLGVTIQDVEPKLATAMNLGGTHGALVDDVEKGGPADKAGFATGDVIVRAGTTDIVHARDLTRAVARQAPGSKVELVIQRADKTVTVPVTLGKLEDEKPESPAPSRETTPESSGGLGLAVGDAQGGGALVRRVAPDGLAAGSLEPGDIIVEVDRQPVRSASDLIAKTRGAAQAAKKTLLLRVKREGVTRYVAIERAK